MYEETYRSGGYPNPKGYNLALLPGDKLGISKSNPLPFFFCILDFYKILTIHVPRFLATLAQPEVSKHISPLGVADSIFEFHINCTENALVSALTLTCPQNSTYRVFPASRKQYRGMHWTSTGQTLENLKFLCFFCYLKSNACLVRFQNLFSTCGRMF